MRGACASGMMCVAVPNGRYNQGRCVTGPPPVVGRAGDPITVYACNPHLARGTVPDAQALSALGNLCPDWSLCVPAGTQADVAAHAACSYLPGFPGLCTRARVDGQTCDADWNYALAHALDLPVTVCSPCAPGLACLDGVCRRQCTDPSDPSANPLGECPVASTDPRWDYVCDTAPHNSRTRAEVASAECTPAARLGQRCPAQASRALIEAQEVATTTTIVHLPANNQLTYTVGTGNWGASRGVCADETNVCIDGRCCVPPGVACQGTTAAERDRSCCGGPGIVARCGGSSCCRAPGQGCSSAADCCGLRPDAFGLGWLSGPGESPGICCDAATMANANELVRRLCGPVATGHCAPTPCGVAGTPCCRTEPFYPACQPGLKCGVADPSGVRTCASCGGPNQPCCDNGVCTAGLGCSNSGVCRDCGALGSACCPDGTCVGGYCNPQTNQCEPCSNNSQCPAGQECYWDNCRSPCSVAGQACCDREMNAGGLGPGFLGRCATGLTCSFNLGVCVDCGWQGGACCRADTRPSATSGAGTPYCRDPQNLCVNQRCQHCGGTNEPCCAGNACAGTDAVCDTATGTCRPCGAEGQACCANSTCNAQSGGASLVCGTGGTCQRCGGVGQACCAGGVCNTTPGGGRLVCDGTVTCVPCGSDAQPCCAHSWCDPNDPAGSLRCLSDRHCSACGQPGALCCPSGVTPACDTGTVCASYPPTPGEPPRCYCGVAWGPCCTDTVDPCWIANLGNPMPAFFCFTVEGATQCVDRR